MTDPRSDHDIGSSGQREDPGRVILVRAKQRRQAMPQTAFRHTPEKGLHACAPKTPTRADLNQEQEKQEKSILPQSDSILPEAKRKKRLRRREFYQEKRLRRRE